MQNNGVFHFCDAPSVDPMSFKGTAGYTCAPLCDPPQACTTQKPTASVRVNPLPSLCMFPSNTKGRKAAGERTRMPKVAQKAVKMY